MQHCDNKTANVTLKIIDYNIGHHTVKKNVTSLKIHLPSGRARNREVHCEALV